MFGYVSKAAFAVCSLKFHVVELLLGYTIGPAVKEYTSAYKVFTRLKEEVSNIDRFNVTYTAYKILSVINKIVADYDSRFDVISSYFKDFIQKLEKEYILNIFTLNYDTSLTK